MDSFKRVGEGPANDISRHLLRRVVDVTCQFEKYLPHTDVHVVDVIGHLPDRLLVGILWVQTTNILNGDS